MPMFKSACHNPYHEIWSGEKEGKIICLRSNGLGEIINIYKKIDAENGGRKQNISKSCSDCLMRFSRQELRNEYSELLTATFIDKVSVDYAG